MKFIVDENGIVVDYNDMVESELCYKHGSLKGEFIGCLMTPHMAMLHKKMFISHYKRASKMRRAALDSKLSDKTNNRRPLIIYDVNRKPVYVTISLESFPSTEIRGTSNKNQLAKPTGEYFFELTAVIQNVQAKHYYLYSESIKDLKLEHDGFRHSENDIVVICIDFMNSTELLTAKGSMI